MGQVAGPGLEGHAGWFGDALQDHVELELVIGKIMGVQPVINREFYVEGKEKVSWLQLYVAQISYKMGVQPVIVMRINFQPQECGFCTRT